MDEVTKQSQLRWGRFIAVTALGIVAGVLAVEIVAPEKYFREAAAVAEVNLRMNGSKAPTADQVRRRALSTANLSAVWKRLTGGSAVETQDADTDASASTIERWRKQIVVEVRHGTSPNHCRVRFLVADERRDSDAAILAEAVAAQYAGELAAESWYALVDRLRSAEDRADAAINRLLNAAGQRTASVSRVMPELVPFRSEFDLPDATSDGEIVRLVRVRDRLLESLTPAHPEVVAVDARLQKLTAAVERSPIRRMSGEINRQSMALPEPTLPSAGGTTASTTIAAAAADVAEARATVRSRLDELTIPGAVEAPVVTTFDGAGEIWELRNFWRMMICVPALLLAWGVSRGNGGVARSFTSTSLKAKRSKKSVEDTVVVETAKPKLRSNSTEKRHSKASFPDTKLESLEQVVDAVGGPVLAVVSRRREPRPTATT